MSTTPNMNLQLPTVTVTLGPEWASNINDAFSVVDQHDHSSGKGVKISPAGLNINSSLTFNNNRAINVSGSQFQSLSATQTGASNANLIYVVGGNLYFTNGSGAVVQITSGGTLLPSPGAITSYDRQSVSSNLVISPASTFVFLNVDTAAPRTITLPDVTAVSDGRIYIIKDESGSANTNNITINAAGSDTIDGQSSTVLDSNYGTIKIVGNGTDKWFIS